jgi:hypothetical protein
MEVSTPRNRLRFGHGLSCLLRAANGAKLRERLILLGNPKVSVETGISAATAGFLWRSQE